MDSFKTLVPYCGFEHPPDATEFPVSATHWLTTEGCVLGLCKSHYDNLYLEFEQTSKPIQAQLSLGETLTFRPKPR